MYSAFNTELAENWSEGISRGTGQRGNYYFTITQLIHCFKSLHHLNLYFKCKALSVVQLMMIKHDMFLFLFVKG